jgi:hypothetical protein
MAGMAYNDYQELQKRVAKLEYEASVPRIFEVKPEDMPIPPEPTVEQGEEVGPQWLHDLLRNRDKPDKET